MMITSETIASAGSVLMLALVCGWWIRYERDWTKPGSLVAIWMIIYIIADGAYTLIFQDYGPREYGREEVPMGSLAKSLLLWLGGFVCFIAAYSLTGRSGSVSPGKGINLASKQWQLYAKSARGDQFLLVAGALISVGALGLIGVRALSVGLTFSQISGQRNLVLANGGGGLFFMLLTYQVTILFIYFRRLIFDRDRLKALWPHIATATILVLAVGSRAAVVFSLLIPLAIAHHLLYKRIDLKKLLIPALLVVAVLSPLYRSLTRDVNFERNARFTTAEVIQNNFVGLPKMLFGGNEISALDGSIDAVEHWGYDFDYTYGQTFLDSFAALVPRAIYGDDKPLGGASTMYTKTLYPQNWTNERSRGELLVSLVGDLYINYSTAGVLIGFSVLGLLSASFVRFCMGGSDPDPGRLLLYSLVMGRSLGLLRGDFFNFFFQATTVAALLAVVFVISLIYSALFPGRSHPRFQPPTALKNPS
jgi:hypothetical protein